MVVELSITATYEIPDGSQPVTAFDGRVIGYTLPSGETIKPWIVFEGETAEETEPYDLSYDNLVARGIDEIYFTREFEEDVCDGGELDCSICGVHQSDYEALSHHYDWHNDQNLANLSRTDLRGANLSGTDLYGADLRGAVGA